MREAQAQILIMEGRERVRELVRSVLSGGECVLHETRSAAEGLPLIGRDTDLVIVGAQLADQDGSRVCERIREISPVPVLLLAEEGAREALLQGLFAGADEGMTEPFSDQELAQRMRALIRRYRLYPGKEGSEREILPERGYLTCGTLRVNVGFNEVIKDGERRALPEIEYRMLLMMMRHAGMVFSPQMFFEQIWNEPCVVDYCNTVAVHICRIRRHVEDDPRRPKLIRTVWGRGYSFGNPVTLVGES